MGLLTPFSVPRGRFSYRMIVRMIVPGGGLLPSSRVPGVCPRGMVMDEIDTCITSASKGRLIVVTLYFMFAFVLIYVGRNGMGRGHYSSRTQKTPGTKPGPLFESPPRPLLKSGLQLLGRYGTHYETISRRLERMYTSSDTRLEWHGDGPLFELDSNKRRGVGQNGATIRVTS